MTSAFLLNQGDAEELVVDRIEQRRFICSAPIVGVDARELLTRLKDDGFAVDNPELSIEQLAEKQTTDGEDSSLRISMKYGTNTDRSNYQLLSQ